MSDADADLLMEEEAGSTRLCQFDRIVTCPHCGTENARIYILTPYHDPTSAYFYGLCRGCGFIGYNPNPPPVWKVGDKVQISDPYDPCRGMLGEIVEVGQFMVEVGIEFRRFCEIRRYSSRSLSKAV